MECQIGVFLLLDQNSDVDVELAYSKSNFWFNHFADICVVYFILTAKSKQFGNLKNSLLVPQLGLKFHDGLLLLW